jgi:hypothetical protein
MSSQHVIVKSLSPALVGVDGDRGDMRAALKPVMPSWTTYFDGSAPYEVFGSIAFATRSFRLGKHCGVALAMEPIVAMRC